MDAEEVRSSAERQFRRMKLQADGAQAQKDTRDRLMSSWEEGWAMLFEEVSALTPGQMAEATAVIRGEAHTVTEALQPCLPPRSEDDDQ